jgi:hypothetical protein
VSAKKHKEKLGNRRLVAIPEEMVDEELVVAEVRREHRD